MTNDYDEHRYIFCQCVLIKMNHFSHVYVRHTRYSNMRDRLNDLNAKTPFVKPKAEVKEEKPKTETVNNEKEKELKQIKNLISKSEKEIERLEKEIKLVDDKLSDPDQYQTVVNDKEIVAKYEQMKKQLDAEMQNWSELESKLEKLK